MSLTISIPEADEVRIKFNDEGSFGGILWDFLSSIQNSNCGISARVTIKHNPSEPPPRKSVSFHFYRYGGLIFFSPALP
jgi:hypothetical protein